MGEVQLRIQGKLTISYTPIHLHVMNESHMHSVPRGSETHFKVIIVSNNFEGLAPIKRHRLVNATLEEELKSGVHALSIVAKTASEWEKSNVVDTSPKCLGGIGK